MKPLNISGLSSQSLAAVLRMIHERIGDDLSNKILAESVSLSTDTFRKRFNISTGMSPRRYIHSARAAKAKLLLITTSDSLANIALDCGYCSQSHMTRMFMETFGISPGRFRRMRP